MNIKAQNFQMFSGISERFGVANADTKVNVHYLYPLNFRPIPRRVLSEGVGELGNRLNVNVLPGGSKQPLVRCPILC